MSLIFDESGRPFIIFKEGGSKQRVKGLEAHKVGTNGKESLIGFI